MQLTSKRSLIIFLIPSSSRAFLLGSRIRVNTGSGCRLNRERGQPLHVVPDLAGHATLPSIGEIGAMYDNFLTTSPLAANAFSTSVLWGVGDAVAQARSQECADQLNSERIAKQMLTGAGEGVIWGYWYRLSEGLMGTFLGSGAAFQKTVSLICAEQFLFAPIIFALYLIPLSAMLGGACLRDVPQEVNNRLGALLTANAKVWTLANVVIYNAPVQYRVLLSDLGDILWSCICSEEVDAAQETRAPSTELHDAV